jgi:hypothetical protein
VGHEENDHDASPTASGSALLIPIFKTSLKTEAQSEVVIGKVWLIADGQGGHFLSLS